MWNTTTFDVTFTLSPTASAARVCTGSEAARAVVRCALAVTRTALPESKVPIQSTSVPFLLFSIFLFIFVLAKKTFWFFSFAAR
jgi:hypothetical protein